MLSDSIKKMDVEQARACDMIFRKLMQRPISKMFWSVDSDVYLTKEHQPITFEIIQKRFQNGQYKDSFQWEKDIRLLLSNNILFGGRFPLRVAAARQLTKDFESLLQEVSPSMSPGTIKLQFIEKELDDFFENYLSEIPSPEPVNLPPANHVICNALLDEPNPQLTINLIKHLNSPAMLLRIAAFVYKIKPEALIMENELIILFSIFTEEEIIRLQHFLNRILIEASCSKINPFLRDPGSIMKPVIVKENAQ